MAIPALSSDQSNLQTPIWGCHRQLDDQHRNPNINKRDHLVGQLTSRALDPLDLSRTLDTFGAILTQQKRILVQDFMENNQTGLIPPHTSFVLIPSDGFQISNNIFVLEIREIVRVKFWHQQNLETLVRALKLLRI